ncbi:hypothetical protein SteCoe_33937 [Stentor coeruleus]|uniref:Tyrosine-protein kinase ephrin type A/B receptor-like domain-containing protein n=1 Tax=Stentor coeruleus TaxID=5963 RepID=A0A1R2AVK1_9CILI|nr:hypothetical protein SteCoe_33937 [Stentor coeruleus]
MFIFYHMLALAYCFSTEFLPLSQSIPEKRFLSALHYCGYSKSILVFSGQTDDGFSSSFDLYNSTTGKWEHVEIDNELIPEPRHSMIYMRDPYHYFFYIFGGITNIGPTNSMWRYHLYEKTWKKVNYIGIVPKLFSSGFISAFEGIEKILYIYGGQTENAVSNSLYKFNTSDMIFSEIKYKGSVPELMYPNLLLIDNSLFLLGGYNIIDNHIEYNLKVYRMSLDDFEWAEFPIFGQLLPKQQAGAFSYKDIVVIMHGMNYSQVITTWQIINITSKEVSDLNMNITSSKYAYSSPRESGNVFIFGGIDTDSLNALTLVNSTKGTYEIISNNYESPHARMHSSLILIENCLYLFGGQDHDIFYNDLWKFYVGSQVWEEVKNYANAPSARSMHAASFVGFRIFLFGGKNTHFLGDLYEYNSFSDIWKLIHPGGSNSPSARAGACAEFFNQSIFIYGGIGERGLLNDLWKFDLKKNEYTQLVSGIYSHSYIRCTINKEEQKMYVISTPDTISYKQLLYYDIQLNKWFSITSPKIRGIGSIDMILGDTFISIGGLIWDTSAKYSYSTYSMTTEILLTESIDSGFYYPAYCLIKDTLYIFGGGKVTGNLILSKKSTNFLAKICLGKILSQTFCGIGSFFQNNKCSFCPQGTYSEHFNSTFCKECPKGSYNKIIGGTSFQQCLPCRTGSWNNFTGQSFCRDCPSNSYCPYGSFYPSDYIAAITNSSIQPEEFKSPTNLYDYYSNLILSGIFAIFSLTIALIIFTKRAREKLHNFDIYSNLHNHQQLMPMYIKKTTLGGFCSVVFVSIAILFLSLSIVKYKVLNLIEVRTLVPLVTISEEISADIYFDINFFYYGGNCGNDGECDVASSFQYIGLNGVTHKECKKIGQTCNVFITCKGCSVDIDAVLRINFFEDLSFCSKISVNITTSSAIPKQFSSVQVVVESDPNTYFKGLIPTTYKYLLIPTIFKNNPIKLTGYHLSIEDSPEKGSQYSSQDYSYGSGLSLEVQLSKASTCLSVARDNEIGLLELFSALIGTVFGFLSSIGGIMNHTEKYYENLNTWFHHKNVLKYYYQRTRKIISNIYSENDLNKTYATNTFSPLSMYPAEPFTGDNTATKLKNDIY